jgi:hypothetical protein
MKSTTSGIEVDFEPDTEDVTVSGPAISDLADQWERLCDAFVDGGVCPSCIHYEAAWNFRTRRRERECGALDPSHCPALNGRSLAAMFPRQAT